MVGNSAASASMTALALSDIPSHVNTYERLAVWCIQAMQSASNGQSVNVQQNQQQQPRAACNLAVLADDVPNFCLSAYVPCDLGALNDPAEKTWMAAQAITTAAPHTNYSTN
jgi:hypothetical protein